MFVKQSTYNAALTRLARATVEQNRAVRAYTELRAEWNALVHRINALGGETFLRGGERRQPDQFSADEIRSLIQLCHPDKHGGKAIATEMTQKLLKMKEAAHG